MKILFDHHQSFALAHGGFQIQIEQSKTALQKAGVDVDFVRWWDGGQTADIIHFFGLPQGSLIELAHRKGIKCVATQLLGGLGARPAWKRTIQKALVNGSFRLFPQAVLRRLGWDIWGSADAWIAVTSWEAELMRNVFLAPHDRVHVIPNGVSDFFFEPSTAPRQDWLVTAASILPVKRLVETARAAALAQVPYRVIGRPFADSDPYFQEFQTLVKQHPTLLRHDNVMLPQPELAAVYRQARGFVLLSRWESQSLSALEAAASGCPLLLSDLPWARSTFGDSVSYCPLAGPDVTAGHLKKFHAAAPSLKPPSPPLNWLQVAERLKSIYERVLSTSR